MGLEVNYFYSLTPRQFSNFTIGYTKKKDAAEKQSWEQTRWLMHSVLLPHKKEGTELRLADVLNFPWEIEVQKEEQKPKTRAELEAFWSNRDNQKNK